MSNINDQLVLVCGESATGKSACLRNLENVLYLNCESGKRLPFKTKSFKEAVITDPMQVYAAFEHDKTPDYDYIVIDGLNYLMDMYESMYVLTATNKMSAWSDYAQYFKKLMQQYIAKSSNSVIVTAHTRSALNEEAMAKETKVPIKGALANQGVESYFSTVVATKKMRLVDLENYENDLLTISDRDNAVGYKHVFQTLITADTVQERMRSPMGMFSDNETYIDNEAVLLMNRLKEYYA